uniref:Uncharacterized protein n=1 Tax=Anguilla anguilla TaxID=7936 RepID=A0A0E9QKN2_ANGAN
MFAWKIAQLFFHLPSVFLSLSVSNGNVRRAVGEFNFLAHGSRCGVPVGL